MKKYTGKISRDKWTYTLIIDDNKILSFSSKHADGSEIIYDKPSFVKCGNGLRIEKVENATYSFPFTDYHSGELCNFWRKEEA